MILMETPFSGVLVDVQADCSTIIHFHRGQREIERVFCAFLATLLLHVWNEAIGAVSGISPHSGGPFGVRRVPFSSFVHAFSESPAVVGRAVRHCREDSPIVSVGRLRSLRLPHSFSACCTAGHAYLCSFLLVYLSEHCLRFFSVDRSRNRPLDALTVLSLLPSPFLSRCI